MFFEKLTNGVKTQLVMNKVKTTQITGATFHENKQNQVNMCVYMYHLHIHAPHSLPNTTKI